MTTLTVNPLIHFTNNSVISKYFRSCLNLMYLFVYPVSLKKKIKQLEPKLTRPTPWRAVRVDCVICGVNDVLPLILV